MRPRAQAGALCVEAEATRWPAPDRASHVPLDASAKTKPKDCQRPLAPDYVRKGSTRSRPHLCARAVPPVFTLPTKVRASARLVNWATTRSRMLHLALIVPPEDSVNSRDLRRPIAQVTVRKGSTRPPPHFRARAVLLVDIPRLDPACVLLVEVASTGRR